ncbi:MAG TPA: formate dehydrogenase accessory sulfurtransferase FdhD [Novosphingobium sp.]|nr:formate dehydrogenase accessory sulfurtransferase FdhD [Novosphingobium sp.]
MTVPPPEAPLGLPPGGGTSHRRDGTCAPVVRAWVPEVPVALEYNGLAYAVMMATPADLADFATGFALSEGIIASAAQVRDIAPAQTDKGWVLRITVEGLDAERLSERVRARVAESSCGLCGIENLEAIARPLPQVAPHVAIAPGAIFAALDALRDSQPLGAATGAAHAAAFADATGAILAAREDVGRHNAMDKLIGAMARADMPLAGGFLLSTARCSYEIVEKAVKAGATTLVTVSLPTSMAAARARDAGLSLWVLARADSLLLANDAASS